MGGQKDAMSQHVTTQNSHEKPLDPSEARVEQGATRYMVFFALYISLAGVVYNFDLSYGGTVLQMQPYNRAFGTCANVKDAVTGITAEVCSQTALQQGLVSVTLLFVAVGGVLSGITGNYLGRRGTLQVGCVFVAVGAGGMLGTSGNFTAYMVCKSIGGVGLGHLMSAAPVYGAECTSASKRGMLMALYNVGLGSGNAVAAAVCWGSSTYKTSDLAWQIPIICQIPLSFILGIGVFMFPESPRWLLVKGREDDAKKSFAWFYGKSADHRRRGIGYRGWDREGEDAPEMHNIRLRTYGQASTTMVYQTFAFAASFYSPYMLSKSYGNMGLNVGYFYAGVAALMAVLVFLLVPETSRLTLEQIGDQFQSGRPAWKTSTSRNKKIAKGEMVDE